MADAKPRCPYLAINIPGERPFVVERKLYEAATKGINIVDTTLTKMKRGDGEIWVLTIKHSRGSTWGTVKFYNLLETRFDTPYKYSEFKRGLANWAAKAYAKTKVSEVPTQHQKQIARLEKELKKLYARMPVHPLLPRERLEFYTTAGTTACVAHSRDGDREYALRWRNERTQRMQLALIGGWVVKNVISPTKAYELLDEAGYDVKKYSKLTPSTRGYYGIYSENGYWQKLYLIAYGTIHKRRPCYNPPPLSEQLTQHRDHLIQFLGKKREIDSIKTQIESIKQLAEMVVPAANETGVVYA
jgi:hypothetical protein